MFKAILITGGAGALAEGIVEPIKNEYHFILVDIVNEPKHFKTSIPNYTYIQCDIADGKALASKLNTVFVDSKIQLSGIINTPSFNDFKKFQDTTFEDMQKTLEVKLLGYANTIKAALEFLAPKASIVNVGSVHGQRPKEGNAMYAAANAGVASLTRSLAIELRHKFRVNTLVPGGFITPIYKEVHPHWEEKLAKEQVLEIEDIVNVILFLLSDESKGINGAEIVVDGGVSAMRADSNTW